MTDKMTLELRGEREIVLKRRFAAPPQLVWETYTDCEHLKHWWGPHGWDLTHCELDLRVGGRWHYCMSGEYEGEMQHSWGLATYDEIDTPKRLVYREAFSDADGNTSEEMPEMVITVLFEDVDGETLMTSITEFVSAEARQEVLDMGAAEGIEQTWERLAVYLPTL